VRVSIENVVVHFHLLCEDFMQTDQRLFEIKNFALNHLPRLYLQELCQKRDANNYSVKHDNFFVIVGLHCGCNTLQTNE